MHELGHAVAVRRFQLRVLAIQLHPFGGECIHEGARSKRQDVIIAWGGVAAQAVIALAVENSVGRTPFAFLDEFVEVCIVPNAYMAAFNLLPIPPLDGFRAWRLKHLFPARKPTPAIRSKKPRKLNKSQLELVDSLVDDALTQARSTTRTEKSQD